MSPSRPRSAYWLWRLGVPIALLLSTAAAMAQFGQFGFGGGRGGYPVVRGLPDEPGGFTFCRLMFEAVSRDPSGSGWAIEYPRGELNLMTRLSQLTLTPISRWSNGNPGHTVVVATDPELFQCPFLMMASPGTAGFSGIEVERLREYLLKGGFLWGDDFWGNASWAHWEREISSIVDLPLDHPIFSTFYWVDELPQIPSLNRWRPGMSTSELGAESAIPHMRGIIDDDGRLLVLMTHNTDIADGWEREYDPLKLQLGIYGSVGLAVSPRGSTARSNLTKPSTLSGPRYSSS